MMGNQDQVEKSLAEVRTTLAPLLPTSIVTGVLAVCGAVFLSHDVQHR